VNIEELCNEIEHAMQPRKMKNEEESVYTGNKLNEIWLKKGKWEIRV
jgi:hypothetical protein